MSARPAEDPARPTGPRTHAGRAAERIGITMEYYARIEHGRAMPSMMTFAHMVDAMETSADALLCGVRVTLLS